MRREVPMARRKRRSLTKEFRSDAVKLVREGGRSMPQVARDPDLSETSLREWVRQAEIDAGKGPPGSKRPAEDAV